MFLWCLTFFPILAYAQKMQDIPKICLENNACYKGSWLETKAGSQYASFQGDLNFDYYYHIKVKEHFCLFIGIRYAKAPTGLLRFRPPQPFEYGNVTWDVSHESFVKCPQRNFLNNSIIEGQEDCLLLNIYVPAKAWNQDELLPVMFWIHGGSLTHGSNRFDFQGPQDYMDRNVIIVTINYRLGPFGFLSLGTNDVSGNAGFLDQNLALKWVQNNIETFHGDPKSVTLFGESAGSISVAAQFLSPMSHGLFKRIVLQSNTPQSPAWGRFLSSAVGMHYGHNFTGKLGCGQYEDDGILECMQNKSVEDIISVNHIWMGVLDDKFMIEDMTTLLENGQFDQDVEVIVSTTKDEGILNWFQQLGDPSKWQEYQDIFEDHIPRQLLNIPYTDEITPKHVKIAYEVFEYYIGSVKNINEDHLQGLIDLFTDATFLYGIHKTTNLLMRYNVTVYQAILTYEGERSFSQLFGLDKYGVCHADDLLYLWQFKDFPLDEEEDIQVRNVMTDAWVNFAKLGNPTPSGSNFSWRPVDNPEKHNFWNISGPNPVMATSQEIQDRMNFWETVVEK